MFLKFSLNLSFFNVSFCLSYVTFVITFHCTLKMSNFPSSILSLNLLDKSFKLLLFEVIMVKPTFLKILASVFEILE